MTFGTPVTASAFVPVTGNTLEEDPGWFAPNLMMNRRDLQVYNLQGNAKLGGSLDFPMFPSMGMAFLVGAIGADAVTGTAAPYTHTISQSNTTLDSFTVEKNIGGHQSLQYAGCRVGKYSIKAPSSNSPVDVSVDLSGRSVTVLDSPTAVSIVDDEIPFVYAEGSVSIYGDVRAEVSNVQVDINNALKETWTYGNHGPSFISPVTVHVSGTIDLVWSSLDDSTYGDFDRMANQTIGALSLTFTHPSSGESMQLNLPQIVLSKYANDLKMTDVVMSTLTFEASNQLTPDDYTIQAVVTNSVATAY